MKEVVAAPPVAVIVNGEEPNTVKGEHEAEPEHDTVVVGVEAMVLLLVT